jgi:hypothetical protein
MRTFIYFSEQTLEGDDNVIGEKWSVLGHPLLQSSHLSHQISQVGRALGAARTTSDQFGVESLSLVLLELLDEGVLHFREETAVELVPFRRLEVTLLEDGCLAKDVDLAAHEEVPAVDDLAVVFLLARVNLFDVIFGVLDYDLVWFPIELINDGDLIPLPVFYPP